MIGKQTTICRYKVNEMQSDDIEIQMTVEIRTPANDPFGHVSIFMLFDSIFSEQLEDHFYQRLRNGVHAGVSLSGVHISPSTIEVRVLELTMSPSFDEMTEENKVGLGYLLEATICGIVETLRRSLEKLKTGRETYFEWSELPSDNSDDQEK